jgi:hypothetical protein
MIWFGEGSVRKGISEFVTHYHGERNHQGLDNRLILPDDSHAANRRRLQCRQRLGGMLNYYYRREPVSTTNSADIRAPALLKDSDR